MSNPCVFVPLRFLSLHRRYACPLRCQIDRTGDTYRAIHHRREAVERINSQAVALGIERPHPRRARGLRWRNGQAIANLNTLIYTLINLRLLQRIRQRLPMST